MELIAELVPPAAACSTWAAAAASCWRSCAARGCTGYGVEIDDAACWPACSAASTSSSSTSKRAWRCSRTTASTSCCSSTPCSTCATPRRCCARRRAWAASASSASRTSRTGRTACAWLRGRMPVTKALPYEWYDTPNIRVGTFADFEVLARKCGLRILDAFGLHLRRRVVRAGPTCAPAWRSSSSSAGVVDLDLRLGAVVLDAPAHVLEPERELGLRRRAAVGQRVAGPDADDAAPGARADQRADASSA
jgi:hypothetical protein